MKRILQAITNWRKKFFLTAAEYHGALDTAVAEVKVLEREPVQQALRQVREMELKAFLLWQGMQHLSVDVDSRKQSIEIKMVLNRASLALLDVTDAAHLLAKRTEALYLKRLKQIK